MVITKRKDFAKQGFCKILWQKNSVFGRVSSYLLFEFEWEGMGLGGGGCLFEAGRLLTFSALMMGAYSRWALIPGWALIRINTVLCLLYLVIDKTQRRSIGFTFYCVGKKNYAIAFQWVYLSMYIIVKIFASYFLQTLFWVDGSSSSQSSFDKIITSFFWSTPRRRRDENWHHTTLKISNVLQASIPQQYLYVDSCWTTSCSPSVC